MDNFYHIVNGEVEVKFPETFRYYDEGVAAAARNEPFNCNASLSWKDGWCDHHEGKEITALTARQSGG